jgi:hypothetical protein
VSCKRSENEQDDGSKTSEADHDDLANGGARLRMEKTGSIIKAGTIIRREAETRVVFRREDITSAQGRFNPGLKLNTPAMVLKALPGAPATIWPP